MLQGVKVQVRGILCVRAASVKALSFTSRGNRTHWLQA